MTKSIMRCSYAVILLGLGVSSMPAQESSLQIEVAALAQDVKTALADRQTSIAVGAFQASSKLPASAGPAITLALKRELELRKITVRDDAPWRIEGKYADVIDRESESLAVALVAQISERKATKTVVVLQLKPRGVFGEASIAALLGTSVELAPTMSRKERDEKLRIAIDQPAIELRRVSLKPEEKPQPVQVATPKSMLRMEILIKNGADYEPRVISIKDGQAFVEIKREEVYAVRLLNDHDFEIAVQLSIDGLGLFTFADAVNPKTGKKFHSIVIPAHGRATAYGWYRNKDTVNEFLVTEYAKSAAAELKSEGNVGSITASYCASWDPDGRPPSDEPTTPQRFAKSADGTAPVVCSSRVNRKRSSASSVSSADR